jgi:hypothetical protein
VYGTVADKEDNLVRKDGGPFSENDFFQNPGEYKSVFFEKVNYNKLLYPHCLDNDFSSSIAYVLNSWV